MSSTLNRRDFLKLSSLISLGLGSPQLLHKPEQLQNSAKQNILIVVFDALSALNIPIYGYKRETTPNLSKLTEHAHIYHNHFAGGNYTTSGTASLLTGTLPWTHRALTPGSRVADRVASHNLFNAFQGYYRTAYTHNGFADKFLKQFSAYIEEWIPSQNLFVDSYDGLLHTVFHKDDDTASVAWARNIEIEQGYSFSLFLSHLYSIMRKKRVENIKEQFPLGIPSPSKFSNSYYTLEDATNWVTNRLPNLPQPFLGYFHFLPPHAPYRTSKEFNGQFAKDRFQSTEKPIDIFANNDSTEDELTRRTAYDEYILYADKAFGEIYTSLENSGILENTWVIFTSDHGEISERGLVGHSGATLYQPLIRIPLLIFEPGKKTRTDIFSPTSAIDLLPTLAHIANQTPSNWAEGTILPPFASAPPDQNRNLYSVQAYYNEREDPLTQATIAQIQGRHKLIYYFGYGKAPEKIQLFDIDADPEELIDLSQEQHEITRNLLNTLKEKLNEVNKPYL